jgi:hypothetical protein
LIRGAVVGLLAALRYLAALGLFTHGRDPRPGLAWILVLAVFGDRRFACLAGASVVLKLRARELNASREMSRPKIAERRKV